MTMTMTMATARVVRCIGGGSASRGQPVCPSVFQHGPINFHAVSRSRAVTYFSCRVALHATDCLHVVGIVLSPGLMPRASRASTRASPPPRRHTTATSSLTRAKASPGARLTSSPRPKNPSGFPRGARTFSGSRATTRSSRRPPSPAAVKCPRCSGGNSSMWLDTKRARTVYMHST